MVVSERLTAGDVHDKCTRNHTRGQMWRLVHDVQPHPRVHEPWRYALSGIYDTPEVPAAVQAPRADVEIAGERAIIRWHS
jgi:hypothetical protein